MTKLIIAGFVVRLIVKIEAKKFHGRNLYNILIWQLTAWCTYRDQVSPADIVDR